MIRLRTTAKVAGKALSTVLGQVPYVNMRAVRYTGLDVQQAERDHVMRAFTVRQKRFVMDSAAKVLTWPTKQKPEMTVGVDPQRDQLAKFERGGRKVSLKGKPYVAIPSRDIRRTKRGLVPRSMYLSAFRPFAKATNRRSFGGRQVLDVGQRNSFFVTLKSRGGRVKLLMQRHTRKKSRGLYLFVPSVKIDARLRFVPTAVRTIQRKWKSNVNRAYAEALATARPT